MKIIAPTTAPTVAVIQDEILKLTPQTDAQRWLQAQALWMLAKMCCDCVRMFSQEMKVRFQNLFWSLANCDLHKLRPFCTVKWNRFHSIARLLDLRGRLALSYLGDGRSAYRSDESIEHAFRLRARQYRRLKRQACVFSPALVVR